MSATNEHIPDEWYRYAKADLERARKRLAEADVEDMLFRCEQAAEKALKGWLIGFGWNLERTHNVNKLIAEMKQFGGDADWFTASADVLTASYILIRYPFATEDLPSLEEATHIFAETEKLLAQLLPTP